MCKNPWKIAVGKGIFACFSALTVSAARAQTY